MSIHENNNFEQDNENNNNYVNTPLFNNNNISPKINYKFDNKYVINQMKYKKTNTNTNSNSNNLRNTSRDYSNLQLQINPISNYHSINSNKNNSNNKKIVSKNSSFEKSINPLINQSSINEYMQKRHFDSQQKMEHIKNDLLRKELKELKDRPSISYNSKKIAEKIGNSQINVFDRLTNKSHLIKRENEIKKLEEMSNQNFEKPKVNICFLFIIYYLFLHQISKSSSKIQRSIDDLYNWKENLEKKKEYHEKEIYSVIYIKLFLNIYYMICLEFLL